MPTNDFGPIRDLSMLRRAWEAEYRRRGLSSGSRIEDLAVRKARKGRWPR